MAKRVNDDERAILAFEKSWWLHAGNKEAAIRERFGMSAVRFYQVLNRIVDSDDALTFDPQLVRRLRRIRSRRADARSALNPQA